MTINGRPFKVLWPLLPLLYEEMINAITNANPNERGTHWLCTFVVLYEIDLLTLLGHFMLVQWRLWAA